MSEPNRTRRSVVLTETVDGLTPVLMIFSIFLTLRGHNAPGGGFAGGLVMGLAVVLRYLAAGPRGVRNLRVDPIVLIGTGLLIAVSVGLTSLIADGSFLESAIWKFDVPVLGELKIVSSSLFDIGVHILVVGATMAVLVALAEADDEMRGRQDGELQSRGDGEMRGRR
ncbi:MAG: MnhB domain-containing protein [Ilumatobacter sp.]|jgi:multisubunit Na+/H+ antiporter MnhB subunit|uniref:MnhB domain-containing protein n=1 Tax=Ilumatobacter sp. TaxID=1967498 RepID=UPI003918E19A